MKRDTELEDLARECLGGTYGGPSLSYDGKDFVVYEWSDAPVGMDEIGRGKTVMDALRDTQNRKQSKLDLLKKSRKFNEV